MKRTLTLLAAIIALAATGCGTATVTRQDVTNAWNLAHIDDVQVALDTDTVNESQVLSIAGKPDFTVTSNSGGVNIEHWDYSLPHGKTAVLWFLNRRLTVIDTQSKSN